MSRSAPASLSLWLGIAFITATCVHAQEPAQNDAAPFIRITLTPLQGALSSLEVLLEQTRKNGDRGAEANTLSAIANSYLALHQQQRAIERFQAARAIWRELGNKEHEASTVAHIGDVYRDWGFSEQANRAYRDALALYPSTEKAGRGATLNNLSLTYFALNNRKKCLESLNEALSIFRELQDRRGEALALINLGSAYIFLVNDPMKAIESLQLALTHLETLNDRDAEAGALDKMGIAWHMLHKPEMAGISFQEALQLFHAAGDLQGEAAVRKHMRSLGEQQPLASVH